LKSQNRFLFFTQNILFIIIMGIRYAYIAILILLPVLMAGIIFTNNPYHIRHRRACFLYSVWRNPFWYKVSKLLWQTCWVQICKRWSHILENGPHNLSNHRRWHFNLAKSQATRRNSSKI